MIVTCSECIQDFELIEEEIYHDELEGYMTICPNCKESIILTEDLNLTPQQIKKIRGKNLDDGEEELDVWW